MHPPTVLLVPGSVRRDSAHRRLAAALSPLLVEHGVAAETIDLTDHPMPIYHGDEEEAHGVPDTAVELGGRIRSADGMILLSPEYNGGPSALLKNTIDWLTRIERSIFSHLLVGLAATSPGGRGGVQGLAVMRGMLRHMSVPALEGELSVPSSYEAFVVGDGGVTFGKQEDGEAATAFVHDYLVALEAHRRALDTAST